MFAAFLCKEEAIMPSQTKHEESEEDMTNSDIVQDLESGLQDIQSSQKVILNKTFRKKKSTLFRFFIERKGQYLDFSVF